MIRIQAPQPQRLRETLISACSNGHVREALAVLADPYTQPQEINAVDQRGATPLIYAALNSLSDVCLAMLRDFRLNPAILNQVTQNGRSALSWAVTNGLRDVCLALLRDPRLTPASINQIDAEGCTVLIHAIKKPLRDISLALLSDFRISPPTINYITKDEDTALIAAAHQRQPDICLALLRDQRLAPATLNHITKYGSTSLIYSCLNSLPEVCLAILRDQRLAPPTLNQITKVGGNALNYALGRGLDGVSCQMLTHSLADLQRLLNCVFADDSIDPFQACSVLHCAVLGDCPNALRIMIKHPALKPSVLSLRNKAGNTPFELAQSLNRSQEVRNLLFTTEPPKDRTSPRTPTNARSDSVNWSNPTINVYSNESPSNSRSMSTGDLSSGPGKMHLKAASAAVTAFGPVPEGPSRSISMDVSDKSFFKSAPSAAGGRPGSLDISSPAAGSPPNYEAFKGEAPPPEGLSAEEWDAGACVYWMRHHKERAVRDLCSAWYQKGHSGALLKEYAMAPTALEDLSHDFASLVPALQSNATCRVVIKAFQKLFAPLNLDTPTNQDFRASTPTPASPHPSSISSLNAGNEAITPSAGGNKTAKAAQMLATSLADLLRAATTEAVQPMTSDLNDMKESSFLTLQSTGEIQDTLRQQQAVSAPPSLAGHSSSRPRAESTFSGL